MGNELFTKCKYKIPVKVSENSCEVLSIYLYVTYFPSKDSVHVIKLT